jgi:glucokinase
MIGRFEVSKVINNQINSIIFLPNYPVAHMTSFDQEYYLGIEIGGTKLQLVIGDATATILRRVRQPIDAAKGATGIREQIKEGITKLTTGRPVKAIGVGFGGPVKWNTGEIQLSHQVEGWGNFNLKTWLEDLTRIPVLVDNDANTAALAEAKRGCGKGYQTVFYMTIGSGIGGGMIVDGRIYHGRPPGEVEIGHLRMNRDGITLENLCSGWAVNKKVREHIETSPGSLISRLAENNNSPEAYFLKPALDQNDPEAIRIVDGLADDLSFALSHVVHLFNPQVIILGGGLSLLGEYLCLPVTKNLPKYMMQALLPAAEIKIASLGEDVVPIGALELAIASSGSGF